jgi:aryl-alcohol dehydrogenase-like predicted oxidoreductase
MTTSLWDKVTFGRTGLEVSRLAIGSSYGIGGKDLERAYERGINFFFWGLRRTGRFAEGMRAVAANHRDEMCIAIQTYSRSALLLRPWVERALRGLKTDYVDILTLSWWSQMPPDRIVDAALRLRDEGKARHIMISCHHRPSFPLMIADPRFEAIMARYNAAHTGAEREVFPALDSVERRPGVLAFTATRWGTLMDPAFAPPGERTPTATDCYRFVLSDSHVDVSLCGPKNGAELDGAFAALDQGPLDAEEMAWMRRVGVSVHEKRPGQGPINALDKLAGFFKGRRPDVDHAAEPAATPSASSATASEPRERV